MNYISRLRQITILSFLLLASSLFPQPASAFWPFTSKPDITDELQKDKARLQSQNDTLTKENADLRKQIGAEGTRNGYLVVATWIAFVSAFVLFCIGLAVGAKIKQRVIQHESGPR